MMFASRRNTRYAAAAVVALGAALGVATRGWCQAVYHKPPQAIVDLINAPAPYIASVSPARDRMLIYAPVHFPDISELARPMYRLAGLRIDPGNNGPHVPQRYINWRVVNLASGASQPLAIPAAVYAGAPIWSPDGRRFAFLNYGRRAVELWIGDAGSGAVRRLGTLAINAVIQPVSFFGNPPPGNGPVVWMPDSRHLLVRLVPAGRGAVPQAPAVPPGPIVQEADGDASPVPTYEDLLTSPHDEDLFTYFATAQLAVVDASSGQAQELGQPAIFATNAPSPDGRHILVARIHKPYSYLAPYTDFARQVEVWNLGGHREFRLADLPLSEHTPINGVPAGPRSYDWAPTQPATLVWTQALDGGDPRKTVPYRDRLLALAAPFTGAPVELAKTEDRLASVEWGSAGDLGILREARWRTATNRVFFFDPNHPGQAPRLVWTLNTRSQYDNPGSFIEQVLPNGQRAVLETAGSVFLAGAGASPEGDHPFLDRLDIQSLRSERLFHCAAKVYERVAALLAPDGSRFLTERETPADPPNYWVRGSGGEDRMVSHFADPTPIVRSIRSELVTYQRADGVPLSMTVYLPPDYKQGERRPAVVVGYPLEYSNAKMAGQVTGSPYRFISFPVFGAGAGDTGGPLYLLLDGYVILDNVAMPIVGPPSTVNDTYVDQLVADAKAAIDKAAAMGVLDPNRVGVTGHSYGAFMTANLLAHSNLFRAGCAQSGAYNRTLTPFGFQSERRTFWEAEPVYEQMSPFFFANKFQAPVLLIHGMDDNNSGTFPIQSLRLYEALQGNGATVRYVQLPYESHIYIGRQSIEEVEWEMMTWFDKYVKNAPAEAGGGAGRNRDR
ncbi:MAG TPA: prolyl oligopeptidase family serine peptidase [Candidatus Acidoferrales bacterium]|nr:prolyl oligopeptidase family serine peptidase [Candidatus Acidoferrales bacterium]